MTPKKRAEIERLALVAFELEMRYRNEGMRCVPTDYEERKKSAVEYALLGAEFLEAKRRLDDASQP